VHAALQLAGKRRRRGQLNAVVPGELLRVTDTATGLQFLVDTGAAFPCIPRTSPLPGLEQLPRLKAAGGQSIQCFGEVAAVVCFGGRRFKWTFLNAAVEEPLLGGDFLRHYKLVVDLANKCLFDAVNGQRVVVGDLAVAGGLAALHSTLSPPPIDLSSLRPRADLQHGHHQVGELATALLRHSKQPLSPLVSCQLVRREKPILQGLVLLRRRRRLDQVGYQAQALVGQHRHHVAILLERIPHATGHGGPAATTAC
jgi:hypothetical protein